MPPTQLARVRRAVALASFLLRGYAADADNVCLPGSGAVCEAFGDAPKMADALSQSSFADEESSNMRVSMLQQRSNVAPSRRKARLLEELASVDAQLRAVESKTNSSVRVKRLLPRPGLLQRSRAMLPDERWHDVSFLLWFQRPWSCGPACTARTPTYRSAGATWTAAYRSAGATWAAACWPPSATRAAAIGPPAPPGPPPIGPPAPPADPLPTGFECESKSKWTNGYGQCYKQSKDRRACVVNQGWTCVGYQSMGWCENNQALKKFSFAMGPSYNSPEVNCCECGGGSPTVSKWSVISTSAACEKNDDGIKRSYGEKKHTLQSCKTACEGMSGCVAIDFYKKSGWCNLFNRQCSTPQKTDSGASSYALEPTFGVAFDADSEGFGGEMDEDQ
eukprot:CAMPEP_0117494008 /NCGR_PEP_ID=MMETSP0784-20121206/19390_1 /TAXON_ID=39447 /ORGANISM="" /LENGTH=391 /DNA_ID=CAMNT_0005288875 /DNA_START=122 /DNA_END=1297 /DNA_ORIENTATION=-